MNDWREALEGDRLDLTVPRYVPTRTVFGDGAARDLAALCAFHTPLVLTGRRTAAKPWLEETIAACGPATVVENPRSNPTPQSIQHVLDTARRTGADSVIAIGGGSVLDTGKAVALLTGTRLSVEQALNTPVPPRRTGLVAVPTTAGSGAEVTRTATVWDETARRKRALDHAGLFPDLAVVDPLLTASAPAEVRASCGLDALAQAIESSWSVAASEESLRFSLPAVALAHEALDALGALGAERPDRVRLSLASLLAGLAIAGTRTTVPHAVSYPLTLRHGIPHGHACALTLGAVLRFNAAVTDASCRDPRGPDHTRAVVRDIQHRLGADTPGQAHRRLTALVEHLGLPTLHQLDVDTSELADDVASYDRFDNNPRHMSRDQLAALLRAES
ncbi:phosphonoacetaldehyde reductase [Streptomyces acidiscabies]|uniref:phosphonoacetaldehyde reductase n=1 Tax=Streptomyces acidiscabies TaxID=42234 RepID=UPI000965CDF5|nr:phosphonoacetaldehyde reductase [Streptomyces acidiscabies]GAV39914.1 phosphonoacetaldehyde reductase [Streptomyces acidiscabies]